MFTFVGAVFLFVLFFMVSFIARDSWVGGVAWVGVCLMLGLAVYRSINWGVKKWRSH